MFYQFGPDMKKENNKQHTDTGIQPDIKQCKEANCLSGSSTPKKKKIKIWSIISCNIKENMTGSYTIVKYNLWTSRHR